MASVGELSITLTADTSQLFIALEGARKKFDSFSAGFAKLLESTPATSKFEHIAKVLSSMKPLNLVPGGTAKAFGEINQELDKLKLVASKPIKPFELPGTTELKRALDELEKVFAGYPKPPESPFAQPTPPIEFKPSLPKIGQPLVWWDRLKEQIRLGGIDLADNLKALENVLDSFGVKATDKFRIFVTEVSGALTRSVEDATKAGEAVDKAIFSKKGDWSFKDVTQAVIAVNDVVKAMKAATDYSSAFARAIGGARAGAAIGAQVGGAWGALIGGIGGAIFGIFRSPGWAKAAKEAAKVLGVEVSKELAKSIEEKSKQLGIGRREASLLFIGKAMEEAKGKDPRAFAGSVVALLNAIANRSVPAKEGLASLGEAFEKIKQAALDAGSVGDKALVGIVKRARELGLEKFESIKTFVGEQLTKAQAGLEQMIKLVPREREAPFPLEFVTPAQPAASAVAAAQAGLAASVFWAKFKTEGLLAATDAFKPIFEKLKENLAGFADSAAIAGLLGPIQRMMDLASNEAVRGALESAQGVDQVIKGLADSSFLMQSDITNAGILIQQAFQQAVDGGVATEEAYRAIAPALTTLISASENYGFTIDANTQKLIGEAQAHGVAFPKDPVDRLTESIDALITTLGGVPPQLDRIKDHAKDLGRTKVYIDFEYRRSGEGGGEEGGGGDGGESEGGPEKRRRQHEPDVSAQGGFFHPRLPRTSRPGGVTLIEAHPGEQVAIGAPVAAATGGAETQVTHVHNLYLDGQLFARFVENAARTGRIRIHESAIVRHS